MSFTKWSNVKATTYKGAEIMKGLAFDVFVAYPAILFLALCCAYDTWKEGREQS